MIEEKYEETYIGLAHAYMGLGNTKQVTKIIQSMSSMNELSDETMEELSSLLNLLNDNRGRFEQSDSHFEDNAVSMKRYPEDYIEETDEFHMSVYLEAMDKLKPLYDIGREEGIEAAIDYIREDNIEGGDIYLKSYPMGMVYTDFYHGGKIYYGDVDQIGKPSGFGVAFCSEELHKNEMCFIGIWKDGKRKEGIYFNTNVGRGRYIDKEYG